MRKSSLIFCCFSLLSLGAILNYDIVVTSDNHNVSLGFIIKDNNATAEVEGQCSCYLNTSGGSTKGVDCDICLTQEDVWGSKGNCSC